eukprot:GEMP01010541.1.p1 GENE.GEMP01010541.1~~GEMP01010541.1.p1  ORF type:complete len:309 (+),score=13.37 GEMP01010541.1:92-928(+)
MAHVGPYEPLGDATDSDERPTTFPARTTSSCAFFACYGVLITSMVSSCSYVVATEGFDAPCSKPLLFWTCIHVCRHILKGILFGVKHCARDGNRQGVLRAIIWTIKSTELFGLIWWFQGAQWLWSLETCNTMVYWLMVTFFGIQTIFLLIPCVLLMLILLCLPLALWLLPYLVPQNPNQLATSEEAIEKISKYAWNSAAHFENLVNPMMDNDIDVRMCSICLMDFEDGQEVMEMPCDKSHLFHADCVARWLRTSQNCPLCRSNIPERIDADEQRQSEP